MQLPEALFVARTMQALELLALQPLSAPQLAATLQVHPRTARRLLTRLSDEGYVSRSDDRRRLYSPTMRIVALASQVVESAQLTRFAVPYVQRLQQEHGRAAHLAVPSHRSALCLVHCGSCEQPPRPHLRELMPSHCSATGKALLAWRGTWCDEVLRMPLEARTPRTITDPAALRYELERIRNRGYATEDGELEPGVRALAAPVRCSNGETVAALGVALPADVSFADAADSVLVATAALTRALATA